MPARSMLSAYSSRRPSRQASRQASRQTSRQASPSSTYRQRRSMSTAGLATSIMQLGQKPKPTIEIKLTDGQQDALTPSYTSSDEIRGEVSIVAQCDMPFHEIYITFEGFAKTYVEKVATTSPTNGRTEAFALFLRLTNPNDPALLPEPRVFQAKKTYTFPFVFVVPQHLLPQSCPHPKHENFPEGGHLGLPPSLGDPIVAGTGKQIMDDMAPDMSCIAYSLKCRLTGPRAASGKHTVLVEKSRKLRIMPAVPEAPPLDVSGGDIDDYRLQAQKKIKRGFLRKELGYLTMESAQPKSLRLPSLGSDDGCNVSTTATANIRFDPRDSNSKPPPLQTMSTKLKVVTFYSSQPLREIPSKASDFHFSSVKGVFADSLELAHRCVENTEWKRHEPEPAKTTPARHRDSGYSICGTDIPQPSEGYRPHLPFYTARVLVPISLPKTNKVFLPTFHSCLISRLYTLHLYLTFMTPQTSIKDPALHLKLPIQISVEGKENIQQTMTPQEAAALASRQASEFFNPRSVAPPTAQLTRTSPSIVGPGPPGSRSSRMIGFTTPIRTSIDEDSPLQTSTSPRIRAIAEDEGTVSAMAYTPQLASGQDIPPSPGPGWSHRPSVIDSPACYTVRPTAAGAASQQQQQRFQSLSFENEEEASASALENSAPPPDYEGLGGMYRLRGGGSGRSGGEGGGREGGSAQAVAVPPVVSESGVQRVNRRTWRDLTGSRPRV